MSRELSLLFYISCFIISTFFYTLYVKKKNKILLGLSFAIPLIIGGFRYYVGTDYLIYTIMYTHPEKSNLGFQIICLVSNYFFKLRGMFLLYQFLTLLFFYLGLNNMEKKYRPLAYFCFIFLYYVSSFNIMKQVLAVSIIFYAFKYINKKDLLRWSIWIIVATIFHQSALVVYLLYFIFNTPINKVKFLFISILLWLSISYDKVIILLGNIPILSKFTRYANDYTSLEANNRMFFIELFIFFYVLINKKRLLDNDKNNITYIYIYLFGLILMLTGFFNPYVKRIASYFLVSKLILLPQIPFLMKASKNKLLNIMFIILYSGGLFIVSNYILGHSYVIPYNFSLK